MKTRSYTNSIQQKIVRYRSHAYFLRKCINEGIVPTGFHLKWDIQLDTNSVLMSKCDRIKKDASIKLMELAEQACKEKISTLECDSSEMDTGDVGLIEQLDMKLQQKKFKKLLKVRKFNFDIDDERSKLSDFQVSRMVADGNCFYTAGSL